MCISLVVLFVFLFVVGRLLEEEVYFVNIDLLALEHYTYKTLMATVYTGIIHIQYYH